MVSIWSTKSCNNIILDLHFNMPSGTNSAVKFEKLTTTIAFHITPTTCSKCFNTYNPLSFPASLIKNTRYIISVYT